jgi:hypothetical protein
MAYKVYDKGNVRRYGNRWNELKCGGNRIMPNPWSKKKMKAAADEMFSINKYPCALGSKA